MIILFTKKTAFLFVATATFTFLIFFLVINYKSNSKQEYKNLKVNLNNKNKKHKIKPLKAVPFNSASVNNLPESESLILPDGTRVHTLNGVKGPIKMVWPADRPFSPIVEKIVDELGVEWYKHKDGSFSTTRMCYRKDLGRMDSTCQVFNPVKPKKLIILEKKKKN